MAARSSGATGPADVDAAPLYLQLARTLKDEIVQGVHPVGARLPTEDGLCERFDVSRYTVREALRLLREEGLVASRRGAGTVVIPPRPADSHQVTSINDLLAFAGGTRLEIDTIELTAVDRRLAARTGLAVGEEWLQVRGYRFALDGGEPVCWTEYYINRAYAAVGRILQRHHGPIFPLLEDMFGLRIEDVDQQISATLVTPALAAGLAVAEGSAALEVRRSYRGADGTVAQVTINTHPAARFQHAMTMRRVRA